MRIYGFLCAACGHLLEDEHDHCQECGRNYDPFEAAVATEHRHARARMTKDFLAHQHRSLATEAQILDSIAEAILILHITGMNLSPSTIHEFFHNCETTPTP